MFRSGGNFSFEVLEESMPHASKPVRRPQPDVKRFVSRNINLPPGREQLEMILVNWMADVVDDIGQNGDMDDGVKQLTPKSYLILHADGIDDLMIASRGMSLGPRTVYARFYWANRPNGEWYIYHVKFGTSLSRAEMSAEQKRTLRDRLLDDAETKNASVFHASQVVFPAEKYLFVWPSLVHPGEIHVNSLIEEIYEDAQKEASMPENWITGKDMAVTFAGSVIGAGGKAADAAKEYGETMVKVSADMQGIEKLDTLVDGVKTVKNAERTIKYAKFGEQAKKLASYNDKYDQIKESAEEDDEDYEPVFRKSAADIGADGVIDLWSDIPGAGGFIKMFAGMFVDIGLANYAGVVAAIRSRIYSLFVAGFVTGLTLTGEDPPLKRKRDKKYYELGLRRGVNMPPVPSFETQLYLMDYARQNITTGFWAGTSYAFHDSPTPDWDYPHDWEAKWSPALLGCAMVTKLGFKKFMIE
jgi:hypothetical protein